jgi:hypothetical protein
MSCLSQHAAKAIDPIKRHNILDLCSYCVLGLSMDMSCFSDMGQVPFPKMRSVKTLFFQDKCERPCHPVAEPCRRDVFNITLQKYCHILFYPICPLPIFPKKLGDAVTPFVPVRCHVMHTKG